MADKARVLYGQCRLQVDSTSQISLQRYAGLHIPIKVSGVWTAKEIPSSGVTLANTGLTQATLYYIYAFDSGGTLTLEASTTGHATDTDTGIEIKSGDATRSLVGMVYMDTGSPGLFRDTTAKRWCLNWYNRRSLDLTGTFSANRSTGGTSFGEINSEIQIQFLTWADEAVFLAVAGTVSNNSGGQATSTGLGVDSTSVSSASNAYTSSGADNRGPMALAIAVTLSQGFHFVTVLGAVSGGTGTWVTADAINIGAQKTRLWGAVRG